MKVLVYPGSFDPVTLGHIDIIKRASKFADKVVIGILNNSDKNCIFTIDERINMLKQSLSDVKNAEIVAFDGLMVDFVRSVNGDAVVRGIRNSIDFQYEYNGFELNKNLDSGFEAIYLMPENKYAYLSSSAVREIGKFNGDISKMVPKEIHNFVKQKLYSK